MKKFTVNLSLRDGTTVAGWTGEAINPEDAMTKARQAHAGHSGLVAEVVEPITAAGDQE